MKGSKLDVRETKLDDNGFDAITQDPRNAGLEALEVGQNALLRVSPSIDKLQNLRKLDARLNKICLIPDVGTLFFFLPFSFFPPFGRCLFDSIFLQEIGQLKNLTALFLGCNELRSLPASLNNLTALKELSVHTNPLASLPDLSGLVNMVDFGVGNTSITELPAWMACWTKLQCLDVTKCKIQKLPGWVKVWKELKSLFSEDTTIEPMKFRVSIMNQKVNAQKIIHEAEKFDKAE